MPLHALLRRVPGMLDMYVTQLQRLAHGTGVCRVAAQLLLEFATKVRVVFVCLVASG